MQANEIGREGRTYLKVKIKSLDEEIRIIRKELGKLNKRKDFLNRERRELDSVIENASEERTKEALRKSPEVQENRDKYEECMYLRSSLAGHMVDPVKSEYRAALLALAFCKGKPYASVERYTRNIPNFSRVETLARRYGAMRFGRDPIQKDKMDEAWLTWYRDAMEHIYISGGGVPHRSEKEAQEGKDKRIQALLNNPNGKIVRSYASDPFRLQKEVDEGVAELRPKEPERQKFLGIF